MLVELLETIMEPLPGLPPKLVAKIGDAKAEKDVPEQYAECFGVKTTNKRGRKIVFTKGAVVDLSDASAAKYIEKEWGKPSEQNPADRTETTGDPQQAAASDSTPSVG